MNNLSFCLLAVADWGVEKRAKKQLNHDSEESNSSTLILEPVLFLHIPCFVFLLNPDLTEKRIPHKWCCLITNANMWLQILFPFTFSSCVLYRVIIRNGNRNRPLMEILYKSFSQNTFSHYLLQSRSLLGGGKPQQSVLLVQQTNQMSSAFLKPVRWQCVSLVEIPSHKLFSRSCMWA